MNANGNTKPAIMEFPKNRIVRDPDLDNLMEKNREKKMAKMAEELSQDLISSLYEYIEEEFDVFDMESDEFNKDFTVVSDMMRAMSYRALGVPHHLHQFIDEHVQVKTVDGVDQEEIKKVTEEMYGPDDKTIA